VNSGGKAGEAEEGRERHDTQNSLLLPSLPPSLRLFFVQFRLDPLAVFFFTGTAGLPGRPLRASGRKRRRRETKTRARTRPRKRRKRRWAREANGDHRDDY